MNKVIYDSIDAVCIDFVNKYEQLNKDNLETAAIISRYDNMKKILEAIIKKGYPIRMIELFDQECDNYDAEYLLAISDGEIWVEKAMRESDDGEYQYLNLFYEIVFVTDDCDNKVYDYIEADKIIACFVDPDYHEHGVVATEYMAEVSDPEPYYICTIAVTNREDGQKTLTLSQESKFTDSDLRSAMEKFLV